MKAKKIEKAVRSVRNIRYVSIRSFCDLKKARGRPP